VQKKLKKKIKRKLKKHRNSKLLRHPVLFSIFIVVLLTFLTVFIVIIEQSDYRQELIDTDASEIKNRLIPVGGESVLKLEQFDGMAIYADQEITLVTTQPLMKAIALSGKVVYKGEDSSLSISVLDQQNKQHFIFKGKAASNRQAEQSLQKYCLDSCEFSHPIQPLKFRIKVNNASLVIDSIDYISK